MVGHVHHWLSAFIVGSLLSSIFPQAWLPVSALSLMGGLVYQLLNAFAQRSFFPNLLFVQWCCAFLGGCWVALHWDLVQRASIDAHEAPFVTTVEGRISQLKQIVPRQSKSGSAQTLAYTTFNFTIERAEDTRIPVNLLIQTRCYRCSLPLQEGERWQLALKIRPILSFQNPGGFDYRQWLMAKGFGAQGYVLLKDASNNRRLAPSPWQSQAWYQYRHQVQTIIHESEQSAFLGALLLGQKDDLTAEQKRLLMHSGLGHLFVVSGLHVGLVAMMFTLLFQPLLRPLVLLGVNNIGPYTWMVGASFALVYGAMSGFQVPAMRAVLMLSLGLLFFLSRRNHGPMQILMFALVLVLVLEPLSFKSMGSWLSFVIVGALVWGFWGRHGSNNRMGWLSNLLTSQYYAFVAGSLVLVAFAMPVSILGIGLNLVAIPLFSLLVLPLAMLGLVYGLLAGEPILLQWAGQIMGWMFQAMELLQPWLKDVVRIQYSLLALAMLGLVLLLVPLGRGIRILGAVAVATAVWMPAKPIAAGQAVIHILDVGQGSSALVRTQHHTLLVDTGREFMSGMTLADFVIMPFLGREGIQSLDRVLISHRDLDHSGGLDVLARWGPPIAQVITQDQCENQQWTWDGVRFEQMQASGFKQGNNGSCLLKVSTASGAILFAGDIEAEAEQQLLAEAADIKAEVLVVPHHGSRTSSSESWLEQVGPSLGIVSAGRFNRYGHPHEQVVARYARQNVALLGTHSHGAIEVAFGAGQKGIKVSTYAPSTVTFLAR